MNRLITALLSAVAVSAIAAGPAMAFDKVDWDWKTKIHTDVDIDVTIHLNAYVDGMVQVEKLQIFLGDVNAESNVSCITNTPFYPVVDRKKDEHRDDYKPGEYKPGDSKDQTYAIDEGYRGRHDFDKIDVKPLDAVTQLPIVLSSATAIGNNQSITSDVPVFLHDGQFVANVRDNYDGEVWNNPSELYGAGWGGGGGNVNTDIAALFTLGAVFGVLTPANIHAESNVYNIQNASVDSSATAVANNISVTLQTNDVANHILIADITQFALANVTADSDVHGVTATGYSNMRQLTTPTLETVDGQANVLVQVPTPWVSSVATAIGNNTSINVGLVPHK
jgi:hypothetical protein